MAIHLIWGNDASSIEGSINKMIQKIIDPNWSSLNLSRHDGSDINQAIKALEELQTPPLGSGGRVILIQKSPFCNGCSTEMANQFEKAIETIPLNSHLVLCNPNKPDGRLRTTKILNQLIKNKEAYEESFLLPQVWDFEGQRKLVERSAKDLDLEIEPEAINCLVEAIGCDSTRLISELKKLSLYVETMVSEKINHNNKKLITKENVTSLVQGITTNSLKIGECLLREKPILAIKLFDALLDSGEPALRIVASLTGQIRGWLWVSLLEKDGEQDVGVIAKAAGISNPKRVYIIRKQLKTKSPRQFLNLISDVLEIEASLKRGSPPKDAFRQGLLKNL